MNQGLQQFMGEPIEIIYMDDENRTSQQKINILTAGDQCVFAYCFGPGQPKLFKIKDILAVLPTMQNRLQ